MSQDRRVSRSLGFGAFFASMTMAAAAAGLGGLLVWASLTAPPGPTGTRAHGIIQQIVRQLPDDTQSMLGVGVGGLFLLVAVVFVLLAVYGLFEPLFVATPRSVRRRSPRTRRQREPDGH